MLAPIWEVWFVRSIHTIKKKTWQTNKERERHYKYINRVKNDWRSVQHWLQKLQCVFYFEQTERYLDTRTCIKVYRNAVKKHEAVTLWLITIAQRRTMILIGQVLELLHNEKKKKCKEERLSKYFLLKEILTH